MGKGSNRRKAQTAVLHQTQIRWSDVLRRHRRFRSGPDIEPRNTDGFAIITSASDQGMVDIHDWMPVVLPPDVAQEWLEPGLAPEHSEDLARHHAEPVESFEWYEVGKEVGNVANRGSSLIKRI